jgi:hypothetical protein
MNSAMCGFIVFKQFINMFFFEWGVSGGHCIEILASGRCIPIWRGWIRPVGFACGKEA